MNTALTAESAFDWVESKYDEGAELRISSRHCAIAKALTQ